MQQTVQPPEETPEMLNEQDQPAQADQGTPEEQDASKRMELAALQLLYDKKTHPGIMKLYKSASDDPQQAVSEVTLKIMSILREKAKGVPESTVIPTALKIMMYVTELGEVSGTIDPLDEQGLQETMRLVTQGLLQMYGVPQDELAAKMQGMQGQQMQPGGQPMATQQPPQAPHPGVVNGAMQPPGGA